MIHTQDADFTLYQGDVLEQLALLPDESVHCVVTSPPYWGLRDYGVENQLGLEPTPDAYVARMVKVFREVRRVLRSDGTCWVNLGDSYVSTAPGTKNAPQAKGSPTAPEQWANQRPEIPSGLKPKDLVGIPWRVAFALQADGWYLRSDIIWSKPNPMPESVTDRPTKAHEYVFLLAKSPRYYFDAEAVREPLADPFRPSDPYENTWDRQPNSGAGNATVPGGYKRPGAPIVRVPQLETLDGSDGESPRGPDGRRATRVVAGNGSLQHRDGERWPNSGRNVRSVWEIATQPYPEAHFATYPEELVRRCILAGTSERGCCPVCGKPWEREVERELVDVWHRNKRPTKAALDTGAQEAGDQASRRARDGHVSGHAIKATTLGWRPGCDCDCPRCGLPYVHDADMPALPLPLQEEAESPAVLQSSMCEQSSGGETTEALDYDEGLRLSVHAGSPVSVKTGSRDGASCDDGEGAGQVLATGRDRPSQEREEGGQPTGESRSDAEALARPEAEEAAAPDSVPTLRGADSGSESAVRGCRCGAERPVAPCVVLDPFLGSGTTAYVARLHGRRSIGIELNGEYCELAARRMQQQSLFAAELE